MGQTTLDLPDPLETPGDTDAAGADDLLSQLAGDEIDRLLAESDVDPVARPAADPAPGPRAASPPDSSAQETRARNDVAKAPATASNGASREPAPAVPHRPIPPVPRSDSSPSPVARPIAPVPKIEPPKRKAVITDELGGTEPADEQGELAAGLDALFAKIDKEGPSTSAVEADRTVGAVGATLLPELNTESAERTAQDRPPTEELATSTAERQGLRLPKTSMEEQPTDAPEVESQEAADAARSEKIPLPVRLLRWIDAPLAGCSDPMRDALGKIAIVTMVNAVAVLIYVLLFRRR